VPGGHLIPFLAFWSSNLIIYWSGWDIVWKLAVAIAIGFLLLPIYHVLGHDTPKLDLRSGASWVLPWLAGLLVISWLGNYPEPAAGNQNVLSFGTAIPALFALSVLVYVIAYLVPLRREEIEEHIEASRREAEYEEKELGAAP
jgi:hypothetical protein